MKPPEQVSQITPNTATWQPRAATEDDHQRKCAFRRTQECLSEADGLTHMPLDPVAVNGAQLPSHRESHKKPTATEGYRSIKHANTSHRQGIRLAFGEQRPDQYFAFQADPARQFEWAARRPRRNAHRRVRSLTQKPVADRQTLAVSAAAARKRFTTVLCPHAKAKTVFVPSLAATWLICPFHTVAPLRFGVKMSSLLRY